MANFRDADRIRKANEGLYNPGGKGILETYAGIDRGANPKWSGWAIIDGLKPRNTTAMNNALALNAGLQEAIIKFYSGNYWNPLRLSEVKDQQIANNIYDCSVNQGVGIAARFMQYACNKVISNSGANIGLLVVDGKVGDKTINTINALEPELVFNTINELRRDRYVDTANNNPDKKQWLKAWLKRLESYKHDYL